MLPSTCYIHFDESRIPFYSTSNGYKNWKSRKVETNPKDKKRFLGEMKTGVFKQRHKWKWESPNIEEEQIVLLKENSLQIEEINKTSEINLNPLGDVEIVASFWNLIIFYNVDAHFKML